jgi:Cupin superfamily protein
MVAQPVGQEPKSFEEIAFDDRFPAQALEFVHDLHLDDRVTHAAIADLADRLPRESVISDTATQPLLVPHGGPPRGELERPGDVIRDLDNANAWLTMLNVDDDPAMADLMNSHLDQLEAGIVDRQGKMRKRVAFVFVSSPNSVTPVHFDIEHSLLMQVSGSKTVSIGRFETEGARRHEIDRYWDGSHGRIEALPPEIASYTLTPGRGVYIPPGTPHWVQNGPAISLSVTLTYFTAATVRENRIEDFNSHLRHLHLHPRGAGRSAAIDTAKVCGMQAWTLGRRLKSVVIGPKQRDTKAAADAYRHRVDGS